MSAQDYLNKAKSILAIDDPEGRRDTLRWSNRAEGKAVINRLREMQAQLRRLKQEVTAEARSVRSELTSKRVAVGKGVGSFIAGQLLGRRSVGRYNEIQRQKLRVEQHNTVEPYEEVKRFIDRCIDELNALKARVESSPQFVDVPVSPRVQRPQVPRVAGQGTFPPPVAAPSSLPPSTTASETSAEAEPDRYYVRFPDGLKGPFSAEQVRGFLLAGLINGETQLRIRNMWLAAKHSKVSLP